MSSSPFRHALTRMSGRDPEEIHRVSSPLELFFDLTFAIAIGTASSQFAHAIITEHVWAGLIGFAFSMFAITWAWINFSWFASAYDTDDWGFRVLTMVQMVGVLVVAMGVEPLFASLIRGQELDDTVIVLGYVVMRVATIAQWLRAAKADSVRRKTALIYAKYLALVQLGWVAVIFLHTNPAINLLIALPLFALEMLVPWLAERRAATPWHPHHIAERYSLLAIITLGECLLGSVESLRAVVAETGWSLETALVGLAGTGLTFALWWLYFIVPAGDALHARRNRAFGFGYLHILLFAAIAGVGAGLHVVAQYMEGSTAIGPVTALASVAIPVALFAVMITVIFGYLLAFDPLHAWLTAAAVVILAGAVVLTIFGLPLPVGLIMVMIAPAVSVVADEIVGHRHRAQALAALRTSH
ncbi:MAG: low temperature requirement protein A [Acidobacteria bacterium]|nr:low temperature requirement protein A [Acidobacteriota bacterium]